MFIENARATLRDVKEPYPKSPEPIFTDASVAEVASVLGPATLSEDGYTWEIELDNGNLQMISLDLHDSQNYPPVSIVQYYSNERGYDLHGISGIVIDTEANLVSFVKEGANERQVFEFGQQGLIMVQTTPFFY